MAGRYPPSGNWWKHWGFPEIRSGKHYGSWSIQVFWKAATAKGICREAIRCNCLSAASFIWSSVMIIWGGFSFFAGAVSIQRPDYTWFDKPFLRICEVKEYVKYDSRKSGSLQPVVWKISACPLRRNPLWNKALKYISLEKADFYKKSAQNKFLGWLNC